MPNGDLLQSDPDCVECDVEEMIDQHQWMGDQTSEHTTRLADAFSATQKVLEAALLDVLEVLVVGRKERVERHGEDVDDRRAVLALPVECRHGGDDCVGIFECGDVGRREKVGEEDYVIKSNSHATAGQGMAHVHCVAEHN